MLCKNGTGNSTSESSPIATVTPENTTERPAVSIAATTASSPERCSVSSRHRVVIKSE